MSVPIAPRPDEVTQVHLDGRHPVFDQTPREQASLTEHPRPVAIPHLGRFARQIKVAAAGLFIMRIAGR